MAASSNPVNYVIHFFKKALADAYLFISERVLLGASRVDGYPIDIEQLAPTLATKQEVKPAGKPLVNITNTPSLPTPNFAQLSAPINAIPKPAMLPLTENRLFVTTPNITENSPQKPGGASKTVESIADLRISGKTKKNYKSAFVERKDLQENRFIEHVISVMKTDAEFSKIDKKGINFCIGFMHVIVAGQRQSYIAFSGSGRAYLDERAILQNILKRSINKINQDYPRQRSFLFIDEVSEAAEAKIKQLKQHLAEPHKICAEDKIWIELSKAIAANKENNMTVVGGSFYLIVDITPADGVKLNRLKSCNTCLGSEKEWKKTVLNAANNNQPFTTSPLRAVSGVSQNQNAFLSPRPSRKAKTLQPLALKFR